jgi:hypothetical protein
MCISVPRSQERIYRVNPFFQSCRFFSL